MKHFWIPLKSAVLVLAYSASPSWPCSARGQEAVPPAQPASIEERLKRLEDQQQEMLKALKARDARIEELEKLLQQQRSTTPATQPLPPAQPPGKEPVVAPQVSGQKVVPAPSQAGLAEATTPIPYQETFTDDQRSAPRPGNAPIDPEYRGFTPLLGTRTWIRIGGYAKLDAIADTAKVGNPNEFVTSRIPVEGEADYGKGEHFAMHAKQTRINLELRAPTAWGSFRTFYENDFFNNSDQSTMDYRLRHFYGQIANIVIGQTWTTFYDPDANPDTLDFQGPGVLAVLRQPQFRYAIPLIKEQMHLALAVEQPKSDLTVPSSVPGEGKNNAPDFTAHWRWEGRAGHVQVGGVVRSLVYEDSSGSSDNPLGWGLNLSGVLRAGKQDNLLASLSYGHGIGRYIQDLPGGSAAVVDAHGQLTLLPAFGAYVGYQHRWAEHWRSTATYGYVQLDNRAEQGGGALDHTHYVSANLIWAPTVHFSMGLEYLYGFKQVRSGETGEDHRVQYSIKYNLVR